MKKSLSVLATLGLTLTRVCAAAPPPAAAVLLQRILAEPGQYSQMCSLTPILPVVPLPIYRFVNPGELHLSAANLATLQTRRAEVIPALNEHLAKLRVRIEGAAEVPKGGVIVTTNTPDQLGTPLYEIVLGLDAVETLPVLLRLEDQIDGELAKAVPTAMKGSLTLREISAWSAKVAQRDVLSVMLQLLRGQRFQPLLDSMFEKIYADALKAAASEKGFHVKTPAEAKALNMNVRFDPIYRLPSNTLLQKPEVPFTPEVRATVRDLAGQFLKTVPPEKWLVNPDEN